MKDLWNGNYYKHHSDLQQFAALQSLENFPLKGNEQVLDIGCGPGTISKWIADRVPKGKVVGVDSSTKMIEQAIRDYKSVPNLKFFCRRAEDFQSDEKFHVITSFHALHFVKNHRQAFHRIKSSIKQGGRLLIRMGSKLHIDLSEVCNRPRWQSAFRIEDKFFPLSLEEAISILELLGFIVIRAEIDAKSYVFSSPEKLKGWLMGWLCYFSGLPKTPLNELARELTEYFCCKENRWSDIPIQFNPLVVEAYLP